MQGGKILTPKGSNGIADRLRATALPPEAPPLKFQGLRDSGMLAIECRAIIVELSCILFRGLRGASTGVLYIGWAGSYQRIYELFPAVRTLLGTILGLRLARSARVITRGKLSTDTAAGRSTCRSFRSVNESKTGLEPRRGGWRDRDTEEKERNHVPGCLHGKDDKETGDLCQPTARSLLRSRQWIQPQSGH